MRTAVAGGAGGVVVPVRRAAARKVHGRLPVLRLHPVAEARKVTSVPFLPLLSSLGILHGLCHRRYVSSVA